LKISNLGDAPIDIYAGKQNLQYGDGFIIGNNGNGFMALRLLGRLEKPIPWEAEVFTAKISEAYKPDSDHDIYGAVAGLTWSKLLWEAGYFEDRDFSGSKYRQGLLEADTRDIVKQYYDFRVGRREKFANYHVEIAKQQGYILKPDRTKVALDGLGYILQGELVGENTKLGKVVARALFQCSTGDDNTLSLDDTDESFTPTLMRRSDGLEKFGYGELCAATPMGMFFEVPENYSGINTLSVGAAFSPLYAWTFDVTYYLYSASQGPRGAPTASGFERIFGAEYAMGVEMDLSAKYIHSKFAEFKFSYARYTPPNFAIFWPKSNPASRYQLEVSTKF